MSPIDLKQVENICNEVLEMASTERARYLAKLKDGDPALAEEVQTLISFDLNQDQFIDSMPSLLANQVIDDTDGFSGKEFGRYRIDSELGRGGVGSVYLAYDQSLDRKVAIKILNKDLSHSDERQRRFVREAKAASSLNHPNILTVFDAGSHQGVSFIATEFIEGETLGNLLARNKRLDYGRIFDYSKQIAAALAEAHRAGIIHRDIKPENVMIRLDGYVKVVDFGLAKLVEGFESDGPVDSGTLTNPGLIQGTVSYMSPEQARGLDLDGRTDIWSFGVLLYKMITGALPFQGKTNADTIASILHNEPPQCTSLRSDVGFELNKLVERCLHKDKSARIASFDELQELIADRAPERRASKPTRKSEPVESAQQSSSESPETNLSDQISPLIGRESELRELVDLLSSDATRLVSITGVGGAGKTSLAKEAARRVLADFDDGIFFVDFSSIEKSELLVQQISEVLGREESEPEEAFPELIAFLKDRRLLLILDNLEQLDGVGNTISDLLAKAEDLKILVTSRSRLGIPEERMIQLSSLTYPRDELTSDIDISQYSALSLFEQVAGSAKPNFRITNENAAAVAEICRKVDGLPLAIELAAARVRLLAPKAIAKRLEKGLKLLTGNKSGAPDRQQTMHQAIAWSYGLLEVDGKEVFQFASIFSGGFNIDSIESVVDNDDYDIFEILTSLIEQNLLTMREQQDGEPRFRMLRVIREFAREQLRAGSNEKAAMNNRCDYFVKLALEAKSQFESDEAAFWVSQVKLEESNFRDTVEWALKEDSQAALRIVSSLSYFWLRNGPLVEGENWARRALKLKRAEEYPEDLAKANYEYGRICWHRGKLDTAEGVFKRSLQIGKRNGIDEITSQSTLGLGYIKMMKFEFDEALEYFEEYSKNCLRTKNEAGLIDALNGKSEVARLLGNYEEARDLLDDSLERARESTNTTQIQTACLNLAAVECELGNYSKARRYAQESMTIAEDLNDRLGIGFAVERFMRIAVGEGDTETAIKLHGAADKIYEDLGFEVENYEAKTQEPYLEKAMSLLGEDNFTDVYEKGMTLSVEESIELSIEISSEE